MPDESSNPSVNEYGQLERLLREQREALLNDDFATVEAMSMEITEVVTRLQSEGRLPTGACLEQLRVLNEQLMQLLVAKKESVAVDLANVRRKRDLNRSYGAQN